MAVKGYNWCEGDVTEIDSTHLKIGARSIGLRDIDKEVVSLIHVGDTVSIYFPENNGYFAKSIVIRGVKGDKGKPMKPKKSIEEYTKVIEEMEPFVPQELLTGLSERDKEVLLEIMKCSVENAVKLYDITATYDDTKKDITEIAQTVLEVAFTMTIVIDCNTTQILKKVKVAEKK